MEILIRPTTTCVVLNGVPTRLWEGTTAEGNPVDVFVHRIGSGDEKATAELDALFVEKTPPERASIYHGTEWKRQEFGGSQQG